MRKVIKEERGQALVEMTLVLMLLLVLTFGLIDFGLIFYGQLSTSHGARFGARYAAVHNEADDALKVRIAEKTFPGRGAVFLDSAADDNDPDGNGYIIIEYTPDPRVYDGEVRVTVSYPVTIPDPIFPILLGTEYWVSSEVTMRIET